MISYLTGLEEINHSLLNDLYSNFDGKMVKMLSSGASFILAVGDGAESVGDWTIFPMNSILGQPFFFFTGTPAIIDKIVGYNAVSYNHSPFVDATNSAIIDSIDVTGQVAYIKNFYDEFGSYYYDLIGKTYINTFGVPVDNTLSFFDYSLEAHNISGYYLAEKRGVVNFGIDATYHPPERHLEYGLADVFTENISDLTWETEWNKYKCLRFHNFNSTGKLSLTFDETSQNFTLNPFECRSFRNYSGTWNMSPYHYFQEYKSGDPVSYSYWPKNHNGKPWGKCASDSFPTTNYFPSSRNSQSANNLLNPSILLNYVDLFSYRNGAVTELERTFGYYPPSLNAFFHYMHEEDGVDITNLYCINQPNYFSGNFLSGNDTFSTLETGYYQYQAPLYFPSGISNSNLTIKFPRPSQAVTFDLAPTEAYGPNSLKFFAKYDESDEWISLFTNVNLTGWQAGQRKTFYIPNNRPFNQYKLRFNGFESSHLSFGLSGLEFHGLFDNPKNDNTVIGNLFFHRGEIVKANISKTETCFDGRTPTVSFEKIVFNGLDKISDWENDYKIEATEVNGQLLLNNLDSDVYVDLYPISTNLFKNGYGYSVSSGFGPLSLDNGILIDNKIFEFNQFSVSEFYTTYPGEPNHLINSSLSTFNSAFPPVLFGNILLNETVTSGTSVISQGVDSATWPAWNNGSGYQSRVSQNGQRYNNGSPYEITGSPRDGAWGSHISLYAEPFNGAYDYRTGDFYSASGAVWVYGDDASPYNGCYYPTGYTGAIEYPESVLYSDYYLETIYQTGTNISANWGTGYTGVIKLHSDTLSLLKNPVLYGYTGGVNQIGTLNFKYEPEGLTFTCNESLNLPSYVTLPTEEYNYLKYFGPFIGSGGLIQRKRKNWFRGNGFGYAGDYLQFMNWLGPNASSFFTSPRFPRPYNQINSTNAEDFFPLISGDVSRQSGQDFVVLTNKVPEISDFQLLHNLSPLIATETNAGNEQDFIDNKNSELNFYFYKNDRSTENAHFDKNSFNINSGDGFWYSFFRPGSWPGSINEGEGQGFPENYYQGLNRRFHIPLFSEHYNLLAQTVNQCKYADTLPLENFIYWSYSGATFQIRQQKSNLTSLYAVQNYDGPDIGLGSLSHGITNVSYFDVILFGDNHNKILPADYFLGFNESGAGHGAFFRQFFYELGVPVKTTADLGAAMIDMSANDTSGHYVTEQCGVKLDLEGITPTRIDTLCGTGTYYEFASVPITQSYTNSITGAPVSSYYNYIPNNFSNFNWVSFTDWNDKLNSLGLNIPIVDVALPVNLEVLNLTTQDSRHKDIPADITFLNAGPSVIDIAGTYISNPLITGDETSQGGIISFSSYLGERVLFYDGYPSPGAFYLRTQASSPLYFDFSSSMEIEAYPAPSGNIFEAEFYYRGYITPTDINMIGEGDSVVQFGYSQTTGFAISGIETPSSTYEEENQFGTILYPTDYFYTKINTSGDYKLYFGLTENNLTKTRNSFSLDDYTAQVSPLRLAGKLSMFDGLYSAKETSIINETGITLFWSYRDADRYEKKTGTILLGRELVYDDDLRRYRSEEDYYWRLNAFNLDPSVIIKYSPSGGFTEDKDYPLLSVSNYLLYNNSSIEKLVSLTPYVTTLASQITISPFIIEAPNSGVWKTEALSYKTITF